MYKFLSVVDIEPCLGFLNLRWEMPATSTSKGEASMSTHSLPRYRVSSSSPQRPPLHGEGEQRAPIMTPSRQTSRALLKGVAIVLASALLVIVAVYSGRASLATLQSGVQEAPAASPQDAMRSLLVPSEAVTMPEVVEPAAKVPHILSAPRETSSLTRLDPISSAPRSLFM